jgi:hypothetical protein
MPKKSGYPTPMSIASRICTGRAVSEATQPIARIASEAGIGSVDYPAFNSSEEATIFTCRKSLFHEAERFSG